MEKVPVVQWPHKLLRHLKSYKILDYIEKTRPNEFSIFNRERLSFLNQWEDYVAFRFAGLTPRTDLHMMDLIVERIKYLTDKFCKCDKKNPGACADDACILAYDALLQSGDNIEKLLVYSILHHGDSDTVGSIAFSWFGAVYSSIPNQLILQDRFKQLELRLYILQLVDQILFFKLAKSYAYDLFMHHARRLIRRLPDAR